MVSDPADHPEYEERVVVGRSVCDTELLTIKMINKREGFNASVTLPGSEVVKLVDYKPDQSFIFTTTLDGIVDTSFISPMFDPLAGLLWMEKIPN